MNHLIKPFAVMAILVTSLLVTACGEPVPKVSAPVGTPAPSPMESPTPEETPRAENEYDPTSDFDSPEYGLWELGGEGSRNFENALRKKSYSDLRKFDYIGLPYHVLFETDEAYKRDEITVDTSFGDLDGDGKDEAFVLLEEKPMGSGTFAHGFVLKLVEGKLKLIAIISDGEKFASSKVGELLGGHITKGELRVFRWAWDDSYSETDDDKGMKDIMTTTVYRMKNGKLSSTGVTGIHIREFPLGYWPKEPNIMSAKREAEFLKRSKTGDVDLKNPIK